MFYLYDTIKMYILTGVQLQVVQNTIIGGSLEPP